MPEPQRLTDRPDAALLAQYLGTHDTPCPACRYNLRGCTGGVCPECGAPIGLEVAGRPRHWVPPVLALLAFGWVLTAGALNSARNVHRVYDAARAGPRVFSAQIQNFQIRLGSPNTIVIASPPVQAVPTGPASLGWGNVSDTLWWQSAWSLFLLAGGAVGVLAVLRHRRRPLSEKGWKFVRLHALTVFGVYGGNHLYMFAEEVAGW